MYHIFTIIHSVLKGYPFELELAATGLLAFGWILGRTWAEYAEALKRPSAGGLRVAGVCGFLSLLLGAGILIDRIVSRQYTQLLLAGGLLLGILVLAAICHRFGQYAARQELFSEGYDRSALPILPKQRGS